MDLSGKSDAQLRNIVANHERKNATSQPLYRQALEELAKRQGLDFEKSLKAISEAAKRASFLSYGELAAVNGVEWTKVYRQIGPHLGELVKWSSGRYGFMISAIVVTKDNVETGHLEGSALAGFLTAADDLGFEYDDPQAFLKEQQTAVFRHFAGTTLPQAD
jgi:5-methylcytosine-specific restriction enzyme B